MNRQGRNIAGAAHEVSSDVLVSSSRCCCVVSCLGKDVSVILEVEKVEAEQSDSQRMNGLDQRRGK